MKKPKILIGILTYERHRYARADLVKFLRSITYENCEVLFVTNSGDEDKENLERRALLAQKPMRVIAFDPGSDSPREIIVRGRNRIREEFLSREYDYLFVLDDDVIGPGDILERLLFHKKDIVGGWYLGAYKKNGKKHMMPMVYGFKEGYYARQLNIAEVLRPKLLHVVMINMGCTLLKREVVEKIEWYNEEDEGNVASDDTLFFKACNEAGYKVYCDTSVACWHLKYPKEHPLSKLYNPAKYKLKEDEYTSKKP